VVITWSSFEAPDQSAIATQLIMVKALEGNPRVQPVPNTSTNRAAILQRGVQQ
jgi:hypothetical protein